LQQIGLLEIVVASRREFPANGGIPIEDD